MTIEEKREAIKAHCKKIKGRCYECRLNEVMSCAGTPEIIENNYKLLFGDTPNQEAKETDLLDSAIKINSYCKSRIKSRMESKEWCGDCPFYDDGNCKIMERPDLWEV